MTILNCARSARKPGSRQSLLDSHRNDKGVLSAEDDAATPAWSRNTDLGKEIARLERQETLDRN